MTNLRINTDHNFLISIENTNSNLGAVIMNLHEIKKIDLIIPGIGASEMLPDGKGYAQSYTDFDKRIKKLFMREPEIQYPPGFWGGENYQGEQLGGTYWDRCIFSDEEMIHNINNIHKELSNLPFTLTEFCQKNDTDTNTISRKEFKKWWNSLCDSIVVWSHIYSHGDILLTNDKNILSKSEELMKLGCQKIMSLEQVSEYLENYSS